MPDKEKTGKVEKSLEEARRMLSSDRTFTEKEGVRPEKMEKLKISGDDLKKSREIVLKELKQVEKISPPASVPGLGGFMVQQKQQQKQVEKILEQGLDEIYLSLPKDKQVEFKNTGEQTAVKIVNLLNRTKVRIKKIIFLIIKWLSIIPGVNRFFLEQEAKIKADEIIKIKDSDTKMS